jgi:hypothetical protein
MRENEMTEGGVIVALVRDLMFASRVRGVAENAVLVRSGDEAVEAVGARTRLVLVELEAPGAPESIGTLRSRAAGARIVAFGPHVMEDVLEAAEEAGAEVMTRGAFVKRLPALVSDV